MLVSDAIAYALRVAGVLGVGQTALPQDTADAATALKMMLAQWQRKRWLVYRLEEVSTLAVPGVGIYSIGPGVDADISYPKRPGSIEAAYLRQHTGSNPGSFPVDYPLARIGSREEWSAITLKSLKSWPSAFFYDPTMADGTLYVWPVPIQTFFTLHLAIPQDLATALTPDAEIDDFLPPETEEALVYNLAMRLQVMYGLPPNQSIGGAARAALNTMRQSNFALQPLQMPSGLRGSVRLKNPMGGFVETAASVGTTVLR